MCKNNTFQKQGKLVCIYSHWVVHLVGVAGSLSVYSQILVQDKYKLISNWHFEMDVCIYEVCMQVPIEAKAKAQEKKISSYFKGTCNLCRVNKKYPFHYKAILVLCNEELHSRL